MRRAGEIRTLVQSQEDSTGPRPVHCQKEENGGQRLPNACLFHVSDSIRFRNSVSDYKCCSPHVLSKKLLIVKLLCRSQETLFLEVASAT